MNIIKTLIKELQTNGIVFFVRGMWTRELINYSFVVTNNDYNYLLSEMQQNYVQNKLKKYNNKFNYILKLLHKDINTRQAVLRFVDIKILPECFISIQFLIRNKKLYTVVNSRSLDVKSKLFQDIEIAKRFSNILEKEFNVKLKLIQFNVGSLHYYI